MNANQFFGGTVVGAVASSCAMLAVTPSIPPGLQAKQEIRSTGEITRVVDGDTLAVNVRLYDTVWLIDERMRISGIDCPEMNTPEGKAARQFAVDWLAKNVTTLKTENKRDKYGRMIGDVSSGSELLSHKLVEAGHAAYRKY